MSQGILVAVLIAAIGSNGLWLFLSTMIERKEAKSSKVKELTDSINTLTTEVTTVNEKLDKLHNLSTATARDRLNYLSHHYMEQGYIPKEAATPYKLIGEAYKNNDGNTIVAEEFDLVMRELPIK